MIREEQYEEISEEETEKCPKNKDPVGNGVPQQNYDVQRDAFDNTSYNY